MATYKTLAIVDDVNSCDCCGKTGLKITVAMERDDGEILHFGSVCATRHSGRELPVIRSEAQAVYSAKCAAARAEYMAHPAYRELDAKITQGNRDRVPAGRVFREFLGGLVDTARVALADINEKHGTFISGV